MYVNIQRLTNRRCVDTNANTLMRSRTRANTATTSKISLFSGTCDIYLVIYIFLVIFIVKANLFGLNALMNKVVYVVKIRLFFIYSFYQLARCIFSITR